MMKDEIWPGSKIVIYDHSTRKHLLATVISRYGKKTSEGIYPDLVDVEFDDGRISNAHFTEFAFVPEQYSTELFGE